MKKTKSQDTTVEQTRDKDRANASADDDARETQDTAQSGSPSPEAARTAEGHGGATGPSPETGDAGAAGPPQDELQQRVDRLEDSLLRAKADYQNLQRRLTTERHEAVRFANADLMRSLVSVLDDMERALEAARATDNVEALAEGLRLVYHNMLQALRSHGLEPIDALHQPFDPNLHEAMMQQPSEEHPPGTVIEEIVRGYRLRDRVVRPARVIVSKAPEGGAEG